jgi:hypothetical protein
MPIQKNINESNRDIFAKITLVLLNVGVASVCINFMFGQAAAQAVAVEGGAFGLKMGQPVSSLKIVKKLKENQYIVNVPLPNSEFTSYLAIASNNHGLCKVLGIGKDHENDRYGSETRSVFSNFKSILYQKYGKSNDFDFIRSGALWKDSNEWVMSLRQNERTLTSFWSRSEGSVLPNSIEGISLAANATSSDSSYITLGYEFTNFEKCKADFGHSDNSGL